MRGCAAALALLLTLSSCSTPDGAADSSGPTSDTLDASLTEIASPPSPRTAWPAPTVTYLYDPLTALTTFPDDIYTIDSEEALSGVRVQFDATRAPWRADAVAAHESIMSAMEGFDGWGTTAGISLQFDGALAPLPSGAEASLETDALQLIALLPEGAVRVDDLEGVEARVHDLVF